jgi:hypothetical protein
MEFFAEGYARGICTGGAAGSEIEVFVMELDFIIGTIIEDAIQYRLGESDNDTDDPDELDDREAVERYKETASRLTELKEEIIRYEKENDEDTFFGHDEDDEEDDNDDDTE